MRTMQWIGIVTLLLCAPAMSQAPATAPAEPAATPAPVAGNAAPDLVADLDPYDPAAERTRFLRTAGVDNEIEQREFDADRGEADSFVRKFDRWDELLKCDKDKNGRIDWFEADAYRLGIRKALLAAFDADGDGKLSNEERKKMYEEIGKQVREAFQQRAGRGAAAQPADKPQSHSPPRQAAANE